MNRWSKAAFAAALWLAVMQTGFAAGRASLPDKLQITTELTTKNVRVEESSLADVIADALRDAAGTDAAFLAASAFKEVTVPKGTATTEDVLNALSFRRDSISVVKLTGAQIKQALEHGLSLLPQRNIGFLQVSGLSATVDPDAERGKRVTSLKIGGRAYDSAKKYIVAMPAPLADGALTYDKIWSKSDIDKDRDPNLSLEEAVTKYLSSHKTIGDKGEDRIVFKK